MYVNPFNEVENRDAMLAFIEKYNFGMLVSTVKNRLWATHFPFILQQKGEQLYLLAHISKGNRQWKEIENQEVMVVFNGPHTFVSADWYDHENVSTWNYQTVHVYAKPLIIEGAELYDAVRQLTDKYEHHTSSAHIDNMSPDFVARELQAVVGLKLEITELVGNFKLSQNRDDHNYKVIIEQLEKTENVDSQGVVNAMKVLRDL